MNTLNPQTLLLAKWTAVAPIDREKHFLETRIAKPAATDLSIEWVEIATVYLGTTRRIAWRDLRKEERWRQGWV